MKKIVTYLKDYAKTIDKRTLVLSALLIAIAVFCNYYYGINRQISLLSHQQQFISWYFIFLSAFSFPYVLNAVFTHSGIFNNRKFIVLLLLAPVLFAWKMAYTLHVSFTANAVKNDYWNQVVYWPFKLFVFIVALYVLWKLFDKDQPFYGTGTKHFYAKPYWIMLLIMVPLVAVASTQPDFLHMYPKFKSVIYLSSHPHDIGYKLLYELSYGTDFLSIELFFRGFLVLSFAKWAGKNAVLPMALFYCTIHFGKPLGECISSFFGGMILGVVTLNTKTIWGGLIVHLGIAWLMELGGYMGNNFLY